MARVNETGVPAGEQQESHESEALVRLLEIQSTPVPLAIDPEGRVRISGTRVTLDTVVEAFEQGATPEDIAAEYPTLHQADIYTVIGYYLRHQEAVKTYLQTQDTAAESVRQEMETRFNLTGLKQRLLTRRAAKSS